MKYEFCAVTPLGLALRLLQMNCRAFRSVACVLHIRLAYTYPNEGDTKPFWLRLPREAVLCNHKIVFN
jgi:hypothetical protein